MPEDLSIKKTAEELAFLKDAINSIGETVKESLNSRLEESDSILQRIQNNIKKDTTKAILDLGKGFDGALKSQILLNQGALKQSDILRQRNDLLNKEKLIQVALEQAKLNAEKSKTPAQANKNMTLTHIGLFVGGLALGYFAYKKFKK